MTGLPIESLAAVMTYLSIGTWYIFIWAMESLGLEKMPLWASSFGSVAIALTVKFLFVPYPGA